MPITAARVAELMARLSAGWPALPYPPLEEMLAAWKEDVSPVPVSVIREKDTLHFQASLPKSHLRGSQAVYCLAVSGATPELPTRIREFVRRCSAPGRLIFVFCFSEAAEAAAKSIVKSERCVIWGVRAISDAWPSGHLLEICNEMVRQRVPIRMLMPYDITVSAAGSMFYGREAELGKLLHEDDQNFAITGPGRIGKTSLANRLKEELEIRGDPESISVFAVDFFECADKSPTALARKIAMTLEPGKRADRTTADTLAGFIEYQRHRIGSKPTLIFDEVDEVCMSTLFKEQITVPARHKFARFILVGKHGLLRFTKDNSRALANRFRVIKLGEIDVEPARKLLSEPILDLGLEFEDFEHIFDLVNKQTGRSPHMIQFYGQRLVELAAEQGEKRVLVKHVDQLRWDHQTACFFLSPLDDLERHPVAHVIALALLKSAPDLITPITLQDVGRLHGLTIPHSEAIEIGDILVIQNILLWADGGGYRVANKALPEYAGKMGYLTRGLEDAKVKALAAKGAAVKVSK